jgi:hypothetical protein
MEKPFRKTGKVMNVPLLKRFCEGGVFGWWKTVAERVIQFSQPRPQVLTRDERRKNCPLQKDIITIFFPYNKDKDDNQIDY